MKIAFIVGAFPALSETFILNQITGLLDMGHEVKIFAEWTPKQNKIHPEVEKYNLMDRVHYTPKVPESKIIRLNKALAMVVKNFPKKPGLIFEALNVLKYDRQALNMRNLLFLTPFLSLKESFDIIHAHFGPVGKQSMLLKKDPYLRNAKFITSFHGYDFSSYVKNEGEDVYRDLFKRVDLLLANSEYTKNRLIKLGCNPGKIIVHHVGVDIGEFRFKEKSLGVGEKIRILTVARLVEKKGVEYSIRAVARVAHKYPNLEYKIAGDGPLRGDIEALISELGLGNKVKLLGWQDQDEILKLFDEAHIFMLSSATAQNGDQEGSSVVSMEAQAVGLPVVSTYHSAIPEVVNDGKAGFLVPERDVEALAEKLIYLIEHPASWLEFGRFGRRFVEENFGIEKLNHRLVKIYEELLS